MDMMVTWANIDYPSLGVEKRLQRLAKAREKVFKVEYQDALEQLAFLFGCAVNEGEYDKANVRRSLIKLESMVASAILSNKDIIMTAKVRVGS